MTAKTRSQHSVQQDVARAIRTCYIACYRAKSCQLTGLPCTYQPHPKWDGRDGQEGTWVKAARLILQEQLSLVPYVRFVVLDRVKRLPAPNHLLSARAVHEFRQQRASRAYEARLQVQLDHEGYLLRKRLRGDANKVALGFRRQLPQLRGYELALLDDHLRLSALFRYCMAGKLDLPAVQQKYRTEAMFQYLLDADIYDRIWPDYIPAKFREQARQLFYI